MTEGTRRYGGMSAEDRITERRTRLLAAGLELMGTRGAAGTTVRGVAEQAGLAARYVYESFPAIEDLHLAVFDLIAHEALDRSLDALARTSDSPGAAARRERTRVVIAEMVDLFLEDPRKGRVVLLESAASPVLGPRALAESRRFAGLLAATASSGDPAHTAEIPVTLQVAAQFLIGGVGQAVGAVLQGEIAADRDVLVETLVELFLTVDDAVRVR